MRRIAYPVSARQSGSAEVRWLRLHRHPYPIYAEIRQSPVARFPGSALPESIWQTLIAKSGRSAIVRPPAKLYFGASGRSASNEDLQRFLEEERREAKGGGWTG